MTDNELKSLARQALTTADGYDAQVTVGFSSDALTRFGENVITQNVASQELGMSVLLLKDSRLGKASTGNLSPDGVQRCVTVAKAAHSVAKSDPDLLPFPDPQTYPKVESYHPATADLSPEARAEAVRRTVERFQRDKLQGAGIYSNGGGGTAIANSRGLWAVDRRTSASFSVSAMGGDSSGWADDNDPDVAKLRIQEVAERAARKALDGRNPASIEPGAYTVVFEPAAVADFLLFLAWDAFNGLSFVEGRSCLAGKVGQKVMGENITLTDDPYHPLTVGMPFDYQGLPRQRVALVESGVFKSTVHDRNTARRAGVSSTGHAMPQPDANGPLPLNMVLSPGDSSLDEMIASTDRGLLVTRLHYTNILDPMKMLLTGMTRDGFFLIEKGKVTRGLKNMRFTDSALNVLNNVEALSRELYKTATFWGGGGTVCPAIKVRDFHFTSKTEN